MDPHVFYERDFDRCIFYVINSARMNMFYSEQNFIK